MVAWFGGVDQRVAKLLEQAVSSYRSYPPLTAALIQRMADSGAINAFASLIDALGLRDLAAIELRGHFEGKTLRQASSAAVHGQGDLRVSPAENILAARTALSPDAHDLVVRRLRCFHAFLLIAKMPAHTHPIGRIVQRRDFQPALRKIYDAVVAQGSWDHLGGLGALRTEMERVARFALDKYARVQRCIRACMHTRHLFIVYFFGGGYPQTWCL